LQRLGHLLRRDIQTRQPVGRHVDIDLFVLHADQLDALHVRHALQVDRDAIRIAAQRAQIETVPGQRVDVDLHIAEFIVRVRALHAGRQRITDVVEFFAHLPPCLGHCRLGRVILEHHEYQRFAGLGSRAQHIHPRRFLQFLFDAIGQFELDLLRRRARPQGAHHHYLEGEIRVFRTAQIEIGDHPRRRQYDDQVQHHLLVIQRPRGEIGPLHSVLPLANSPSMMRIFSPVCSLCTPAPTMRSPAVKPLAITAPLSR
jgi:hypothetical protein